MSEAKSLHDKDFVAWSKGQADALRAAVRGGSNQKLDWENLAEEVEGLGISERRELHSQIERIIPASAEAAIFTGARTETALG